MSAGLTNIALPDLGELLRLVETGHPLSKPSLMAAGLGHVADQLGDLVGHDPAAVLAVLRIAIAERELRPTPRLELVWTGPEARVSTSRDTAVVVRQLFTEAQTSVLIAGFSFDHGAEIFRPLHSAMKERGVETSIFIDVAKDPEAETAAFLDENWPFGPPHPVIYFDARPVGPGAYHSLHAKCIVVDVVRTLITSANFTDRGQTRNIEAGVLIEDSGFAASMVGQWRGLVDAGLARRWL